jgi:glycosyltransferase involved in cell wall biosynthesis
VSSHRLRVLLLEPLLAGSHRAWADGWAASSRHDLTVLGLPGHAWRWRMTGAAVTLARRADEVVRDRGRPDVVVASDMLDLAAFRGLTARWSATVPAVVVFHENQLTQPTGPNGMGADRRLAWVNWTSALAADAVWFNSDWHRRSFLDDLERFLADVPDHDHLGELAGVAARAEVHPVGCRLTDLLGAPLPERTGAVRDGGDGPLVLWNHRWDHDKGIDRLLRSLRTLAREGRRFRVALVGHDRHHDATRLDAELAGLGRRVAWRGMLGTHAYRDLLRRADVVVSAARQENFGISLVEAVAAGCVPVVPDALSCPEIVPDPARRYPPGRLTTALRGAVCDLGRARSGLAGLREHVSRYDWSVVAPADDDGLDALARAAVPA